MNRRRFLSLIGLAAVDIREATLRPEFKLTDDCQRDSIVLADSAGYELRCHLTGLYPKWWQGRRFEGPSEAWAAGDTRQTTRDIIQNALMGPHQGVPTASWSGMFDPHLVVNHVRSTGGVANCL